MEIFYFGCYKRTGHYVWKTDMFMLGVDPDLMLEHYDTKLPPFDNDEQFIAQPWRLKIGYSALAWWDRSVDVRPGSNSIIFVDNLEIDPHDILRLAKNKFPHIMKRIPELKILEIMIE